MLDSNRSKYLPTNTVGKHLSERTNSRRTDNAKCEPRSNAPRVAAEDRLYYSGRKDLQEQALRAELADIDDLDRSITLRAQLAMLLRTGTSTDPTRELRSLNQTCGVCLARAVHL